MTGQTPARRFRKAMQKTRRPRIRSGKVVDEVQREAGTAGEKRVKTNHVAMQETGPDQAEVERHGAEVSGGKKSPPVWELRATRQNRKETKKNESGVVLVKKGPARAVTGKKKKSILDCLG